MASVSGMSSSNANSLYGNRNVLTGLASGMDTESMIENSVQGIRLKITGLGQKQTKLEWQQEAYRSLTDKMVQFARKYTSYTSATNLLSASFFNKSVTTTANGANASSVTASGRTSSSVQINAVAQLATASRYQADSSDILSTVLQSGDGKPMIQAGSAVDLSAPTSLSNLSGSMTLTYGSKTLTLNFSETDTYDSAEKFAAAIRQQLSEQSISFSGGTTEKAHNVIGVSVENGSIKFTDNKNSGNDVYVSSVSGRLTETFSDTTFDSETKVHTLSLDGKALTRPAQTMDLLSSKSMTFTLDGSSKKITLPSSEEISAYLASNPASSQDEAFTALLQNKLNSAFGDGKITVGDAADDDKLQLNFTVKKGSNLTVSSDVSQKLGLGKSESTSLNTGKTLGELLGSDLNGLADGVLLMAQGKVTKQTDGTYRDAQGNLVQETGERLGADGKLLYGFELKVNGKVIGTYTRDTALESVLVDINSNTEAGVSVNYSKTTNQFVMASKETGAGYGISYSGGLAEKIFGAFQDHEPNYTKGKDAIVNMTVNGSNLTVSRSSNTFDVDGLSVSVNNTFNGSMDAGGDPVFAFLNPDGSVDASKLSGPVTFTTAANADTIVDAIKGMVEDYNAIVTELRSAYSTLPAQTSSGKKYEPLTEADRESMSETAIKNYEEKAKQGILFGDSDLSSLYSKLFSAITPSGNDGVMLRNMGISTDYSQGLTTLSLDETKLREMLSTNPDAVRDAFTKTAGEGSSTNGLMANLKTHLDTYASVEGTKGILINKAGSKYSALSLLDNSIKDQMDSYETQIEKWQDQLSTKVDYYTRQFTRLEQLISQMNSQSSQISSMLGMG